MKNTLTITGTGWVYRNPKPYLRSIVAYHPSLSLISEHEFLATFDLGQAVEAFDYHTVQARSTNAGESWSLEGPLLQEAPELTTHSIRTSRCRDGSIIGFGGFYRRTAEEDLVNRETFGLVPVDLFFVRSDDNGKSWTTPAPIEPPLRGPSWEICHSIVETRSGDWLAPTSTWRGWSPKDYPGDRAVVLISRDKGASWKDYGTTFDGRRNNLSYLEQSVIEMDDGLLLAVAWVYELENGVTKPSVYGLSADGGKTFTAPRITGFEAQTCKVIQLFDGRLLCVYRRNDEPGLWYSLSQLHEETWTNLGQGRLWAGAESGMKGDKNHVDELSGLKFGHPTIRQISPEEVLILFWCQEDCLTGIRWIKLQLS